MGCVHIYRNYLTVGVLVADGAHAGGFVEVVHDGCVLQPVQANTLGNAGRTLRGGAVVRAWIHDSGPAPRSRLAQLALRVVDTVEAAIAVARRGTGALGRGDGVERARLHRSKAADAERVGGAAGARDGAVAVESRVAGAIQDGIGERGGVRVGGAQSQFAARTEGVYRAGGAAGAVGRVALVPWKAAALRDGDAALG